MKDQQVQRHANLCLIIPSQRPEVCRSRLTKRPGRSAAAGLGIVVDPLGPGETAECRLMLGWMITALLLLTARDAIPGEGKYHGGSYRKKKFELPH